MQEHFSARASKAGIPKNEELFSHMMTGEYAENAGAFFGACIKGRHPEKRRALFSHDDWRVGRKMQEHFSARASRAGIPKKRRAYLLTMTGVYAENAGAFFDCVTP
jgi:hypothetical protein